MSNNVLDKFDPYAMVNPKSSDDIYLLACELKEAAEIFAQHVQKAVDLCEQGRGKP
jgi:hypothetical protein